MNSITSCDKTADSAFSAPPTFELAKIRYELHTVNLIMDSIMGMILLESQSSKVKYLGQDRLHFKVILIA